MTVQDMRLLSSRHAISHRRFRQQQQKIIYTTTSALECRDDDDSGYVSTLKAPKDTKGYRKRGRDGTRYSRFHPSNFLAHHMARIVTAAVYSDAEHIVDGIIGLKQRAFDLARAGDPDNPSPWAMDNPAA